MSNPEAPYMGMSDAEKIASDKITEETAAAAGWAQSFVSQMGSRVKKTAEKLQAASVPASPSSTASSSLTESERPATDRAEASLDRAGEQIGLFAAALSQRVRRSAALVREEAEDVLAEAQSLRQKDR